MDKGSGATVLGAGLIYCPARLCLLCKKLPNYLPPWLNHFVLLQAMNMYSCCTAFSPKFGIVRLLLFFLKKFLACLVGVEQDLIIVLICNSLVINDVDIFPHVYFPYVDFLFRSFAHFFIGFCFTVSL